MKPKTKTVRITVETYNLVEEMARMEGRWIRAVIDRAIKFYKEKMFHKRNW